MFIKLVFTALVAIISFASPESELQVAKEVISAANDLLEMAQPGNVCIENRDCYPVNYFDNLCCIRNGLVGKCCNMFQYCFLRP